MNKNALFSGDKAKEYDKFKLAIPHHRRFQATVGKVVAMVAHDRFCRTRNGMQIAECGVGTGCTLNAVKKATRNLKGIERLFAVDANQEMAEIVRGNTKNPKIRVVREDFLNFLVDMAMAGERIDGVYSAYTIHNIPPERQESIFLAIFHKLDLGGFFVDADILAHSNPQIQKIEFEEQLQRFKKHLPPKLAEEWIDHYQKDAQNYFKLDELIEILRKIGFVVDIVFREKLEAVILAKKE